MHSNEFELVNQISNILASLPSHSQTRILNSVLDLVKPNTDSTTHTLTQIAATLKQRINPTTLALSPLESITIPQNESFIGYTLDNTVNIDAFLYDVDEVDRMVDQGELPSHSCDACGSRKVTLLNYISHSASVLQCKWIFEALNGITAITPSTRILDIGSRLGPILYAAWLMTPSTQIHGIELKPYFTDLQSMIVKKYAMTDRVKIHNENVLSDLGVDLIAQSDIIIMNNVFQFFSGSEANADIKAIWAAIRGAIKRGAVLVSVPSLSEMEEELGFDADEWVEEVEIDIDASLYTEEEVESLENVHYYKVI